MATLRIRCDDFNVPGMRFFRSTEPDEDGHWALVANRDEEQARRISRLFGHELTEIDFAQWCQCNDNNNE